MIKLLPIITAFSLCALREATFNVSSKAGINSSCSDIVQQCPGRCSSSCLWPEILCPQSYMPTCPGDCPKKTIPCPDECKTTCIYPLNARCPYQQQPVCPDGPIQNIFCSEIIIPCPDECPHSCEYDTRLPCPYSTTPKCTGKVYKCPKIKVPCPEKCSDNCVYPDKPCPFKYEPRCLWELNYPEYEDNEEEYDDDNDDDEDAYDHGQSHNHCHNHGHGHGHGNGNSNGNGNGNRKPDKCKDHACPPIAKLCPKECSTSCKFKDPVDPCCPESGTPYCPKKHDHSDKYKDNDNGKYKDQEGCAHAACPLIAKLCPKECPTTCKFKDSPNKYCPELGTPYCP